jgi:phenylacetate-CoA ligase
MGALDQLEPIETASKDALVALQLERLKKTLHTAYERVPHYKKKLDAAGMRPSDLKELADLAKFPFTTKDDLRQNYPFGMFAVPMADIVRIHASSGTTGKPTVVGYTKGDIDTWSRLMARSIRAAAVIPVGGGFTERQVQLIRDFEPTIIMVTPSYMLAIADEFERQGLKPAECSLRLGLFGAEPWTETMRTEIERRMGIQALDLYGLSEVMGPGVAAECAETKGEGLTVWEDHFLPEIIDPETGRVLPDGEVGELAFTSLTKEAVPVIRYRTRDLTRLLPGTSRPMRRIERVKGRSDDMLIIRGVNVFPSQIEAVLGQEPQLAPHYVLEVRRPQSLDELDVLVEMRPELAGKLNAEDVATLGKKADHLIKAYVGISATVRVLEPGSIERSQGKAKRVIDKRPKA